MPNPILARADALMQRRRQGIGDADDVPVLTDVVDQDDTALPINPEISPEATEVVLATDQESALVEDWQSITPEGESEPVGSALLDAGVRDILAHELARRVELRLAAELPRIIESTVRDFLAEQQMIETLQARD